MAAIALAGHADHPRDRRRVAGRVRTRGTGTTRDPLIRLGLLANRSVAGAIAYNLLAGAAMAGARTGQTITPQTLNHGYVLGLALSAAQLLGAVLIALTVLRRPDPAPAARPAEQRPLVCAER